MTDTLPKTLIDAVRYFSDPDRCNEAMREIKWPDGKIVCPKCGCESITPVKNRPKLQCNSRACKCQFSYKIGTIFEDSPLGLDKWFLAVWSIANCKNGISSHELGRAVGVTQKTAWFMLQRIRTAMETGDFQKMTGEVESDETFVGGRAENMHAKRRKPHSKRSWPKTKLRSIKSNVDFSFSFDPRVLRQVIRYPTKPSRRQSRTGNRKSFAMTGLTRGRLRDLFSIYFSRTHNQCLAAENESPAPANRLAGRSKPRDVKTRSACT